MASWQVEEAVRDVRETVKALNEGSDRYPMITLPRIEKALHALNPKYTVGERYYRSIGSTSRHYDQRSITLYCRGQVVLGVAGSATKVRPVDILRESPWFWADILEGK